MRAATADSGVCVCPLRGAGLGASGDANGILRDADAGHLFGVPADMDADGDSDGHSDQHAACDSHGDCGAHASLRSAWWRADPQPNDRRIDGQLSGAWHAQHALGDDRRHGSIGAGRM